MRNAFFPLAALLLITSGCAGDPCDTVACDAPPALTCVSASTLRASSLPGTCAEGTCSYTHVDTVCPGGCNEGKCTGLARPVSISASIYHTCAVDSTGAAKCWGDNLFGALGNGSTAETVGPVGVLGLSTGALAVTANSSGGCAVTEAGAVKCWGMLLTSNMMGEIHPAPVDMPGLSSGVHAVTGYTCALTSAGGVKCLGFNSLGELGDNSTTYSVAPVDVVGLSSGVLAISSSEQHTCAITSAGGVKCWGQNENGQLGDGTVSNRAVPVDVVGLSSGVLAISAGTARTCAVTSVGAVKCWGRSDFLREVGDGATTFSAVPLDVTGLASGVLAVDAGQDHSCAVTTAGAVKCWGFNSNGELGNGTRTESVAPVDVVGLSSGVLAVAIGAMHSCVVMYDGAVKCWGSNWNGELGNGSHAGSLVPVDVPGF
jgi:Regulator of Chromosome Condensation (RCC1) repeat protein/regulator of chromosome condensation (RCC1) repeat-containing protein